MNANPKVCPLGLGNLLQKSLKQRSIKIFPYLVDSLERFQRRLELQLGGGRGLVCDHRPLPGRDDDLVHLVGDVVAHEARKVAPDVAQNLRPQVRVSAGEVEDK